VDAAQPQQRKVEVPEPAREEEDPAPSQEVEEPAAVGEDPAVAVDSTNDDHGPDSNPDPPVQHVENPDEIEPVNTTPHPEDPAVAVDSREDNHWPDSNPDHPVQHVENTDEIEPLNITLHPEDPAVAVDSWEDNHWLDSNPDHPVQHVENTDEIEPLNTTPHPEDPAVAVNSPEDDHGPGSNPDHPAQPEGNPEKIEPPSATPPEDSPKPEEQPAEEIYSMDDPDGLTNWKRNFDAFMGSGEVCRGLRMNRSQIHLLECAIGSHEREESVRLAAKRIMQHLDSCDSNFPKIAWTLLQCVIARGDTSLAGELLCMQCYILRDIYMWAADNSLDDQLKQLWALVPKLPLPTLIPILSYDRGAKWKGFVENVLHQVANADTSEVSADLLYEVLNALASRREPYRYEVSLVLKNHPPKNNAKLVIMLITSCILGIHVHKPSSGVVSVVAHCAEKISTEKFRLFLQNGIDSLDPAAALFVAGTAVDEMSPETLTLFSWDDPMEHEVLLLLMERALTDKDTVVAQRLGEVLAIKWQTLLNMTRALVRKSDIKQELALRMLRLLVQLSEKTSLFADAKSCEEINPAKIVSLSLRAITAGSSLEEPGSNPLFVIYKSLPPATGVRATFHEEIGKIYPTLSPEAKAILRPAKCTGSEVWDKFISHLKGSPSPASP
jgi:hypothetical protein